MFCIGLYARHTFRQLGPCEEDHTEAAADIWRSEKSVQTDDDGAALPSEESCPEQRFLSGSNPGYHSDSEDSLCRIEHTPLEGFKFPQTRVKNLSRPETELQSRQEPELRSRPEPAERRSSDELALNLTHFTVKAEVNEHRPKDVTVVWPLEFWRPGSDERNQNVIATDLIWQQLKSRYLDSGSAGPPV